MIDNGIIYMSFGSRAAEAVGKSISSIRRLDSEIPIASVGDRQVNSTAYIEWQRDSPREGTGQYSFLAGKVKPFLCGLTPFRHTLYLDADTRILKDITPGFDHLNDNDICVSYHTRPNGRAWFVDEIFGDPLLSPPISKNSIREREATQNMIGTRRMQFINTGVIFFRTTNRTRKFFEAWYQQWQIFGDWDEQLSFHRAMCRCPETKVLLLPPIWNQKYLNDDTIIWHRMGKRQARE
jgi:hypothetical protein